MRFALYSDLHLEIKAWEPPALDVDVVILAGDIASHTHGLAWAAATFQQPVIYVAGNHEYYDAHLGMLAELQKPVSLKVFHLPYMKSIPCRLPNNEESPSCECSQRSALQGEIFNHSDLSHVMPIGLIMGATSPENRH